MVKRALLLLLLIALGVTLGAQASPSRAPQGAEAPQRAEGTQPNAFYEAAQFYKGLREAEALATKPGSDSGRLAGGLVPHHILAGSMFSRFFLELERHPPTTVIVIGPNHENRGQRIITGRSGWATDFGRVQANQELVERLAHEGLAVVDDASLSVEHSIGALMPYLKYHAPNAKVVPLILHKDVTTAEQRRLAEFLAPLLGPDQLLIASVDFSHYLTRPEAEAKDEVTLQAIRTFDLQAIQPMSPDYLDSPPTLGLLMLTMQRIGARGPAILGHTNSGVIIGSDLIETTSYFTFAYRLD